MEGRVNSSVNGTNEPLKCPITGDVFFEPVLAATCGHVIENNVARRASDKCPICCTDTNFLHTTPALVRRTVENRLAQNSKLYESVYFNLDDFAALIDNHLLESPLGEKYIRLLQHAANHLNDTAKEGNQKGKSAIELLASTRAGRDLLRHNEKICHLISSSSLQLIVAGDTIEHWIKRKKRRIKASHPMCPYRLFTDSSLSLIPSNPVLQHSVCGREVEAKKMIQTKPHLLMQIGTVIDYAGSILTDVTPYQAGLYTQDVAMCLMMVEYFNQLPDGQNERMQQTRSVFPDGLRTAPHFERPFDFGPLLNVIADSTVEEIQAALRKEDNDTLICLVLQQFREDFKALTYSKKQFNPRHLLRAMQLHENSEEYWTKDKSDLFWRQVIGYIQRFLPACYAQAFAQGLDRLLNNKETPQRSFTFRDGDGEFYPIPEEVTRSGIGFDYAVCSNGVTSKARINSVSDAQLFEAFIEKQSASVQKLCQDVRSERRFLVL